LEETAQNSEIALSDDWRDVLASAAQETYDQSGHGLLLSRVPYVLRQCGVDVRQILQGRRLAAFLVGEARDKFHVVQNEINKVLWSILPPSVIPETPFSQYFAAPKATSTENHLPRYHSAVWRCFVKELAPGYRRWINLIPPISFVDLSETESDPNGIEVEREFVRTDSLFKSNDEISANIQRWSAKHQIDSSQITILDHRKPQDVGRGSRRNPMIEFLNSLNAEEARRIQIPADIVARFAGLRLHDRE